MSTRLIPLCAIVASLMALGVAVASGTTEVKLIKDMYGQHFLGQQRGYSLYTYCSPANCRTGHSSSMFRPMIAYHQPVAGPGVKQSKLGTKRIRGEKVVTYYGEPLYRYKGDRKPGQYNGQATQQGKGAWYLIDKYGQPQLPASLYRDPRPSR